MPRTSLIRTTFDATSTADDVVAGLDLTGVRAVVTGATSGIGRETARALASIGAEVTIAVRNTDAGIDIANDIAATTGNSATHVAPPELAAPATITRFVDDWDGPLH